MTQPSDYFDRAKALQQMILEAQDDLRQLRTDAIEELIPEGTPKEKAKEIRADLAEVFSVAKIAAKGDMEERKQAEKLARRRRIAEQCGVQLDLPLSERLAEIAAKGKRDIERVFGGDNGRCRGLCRRIARSQRPRHADCGSVGKVTARRRCGGGYGQGAGD
jgi:hypothetical protein